MRKISLAILLATLALLTSCSTNSDNKASTSSSPSATSGEPVGVGVTVGEATVRLDENGQRYWYLPEKTEEEKQQELLEKYELVGVPDVPPMNEVPFIAYTDEYQLPWYECVSNFGFTFEHEEGYGWSISVDPEQRNAFNLAQYKCDLMYPMDPSTIHPPMSESQVSYYYDWQTGPARKCYEEHGYPVADPPSKQVFVDDWFDNMKFDTWFLGNYAPDDMEFVNKTCPWSPPDIWEH